MNNKFVAQGEYVSDVLRAIEKEIEERFPDGYVRYKLFIIEILEEK